MLGEKKWLCQVNDIGSLLMSLPAALYLLASFNRGHLHSVQVQQGLECAHPSTAHTTASPGSSLSLLGIALILLSSLAKMLGHFSPHTAPKASPKLVNFSTRLWSSPAEREVSPKKLICSAWNTSSRSFCNNHLSDKVLHQTLAPQGLYKEHHTSIRCWPPHTVPIFM